MDNVQWIMYSGPHPLMVAAKLNTMERLYYLRNFQTLLEKVANKHIVTLASCTMW